MSFKASALWMTVAVVLSLTFASTRIYSVALARETVRQAVALQTTFITAEELKAKLSRNEPVTIIDVRSANGLDSNNKIKGAFYVKLRRLKYRLSFAPLKDVPRDRDVVTYCACPNDEASVKAAQILRESGFKHVHVLRGGWVVWKKVNGQIERMARGI
ncbi:MAG TPA: rhodanese-like domain-containing protein [Pyrinomonadaceae bacterium]|nr:rhodanese-like domain-containing protein [Pyrinomonadaceae bacterium]